MILGNPYKFSIFINTIKEWNVDETFCNGVLLFCIDGNLFPKEIVTASLTCEIPPLKEKLMHLTINEKLYNMSTDKAFIEIYNSTFPEDVNVVNNDCFDITPLSFSDCNCYVFAVSNGKKVRIMAAKLNYIVSDSRHELNKINISETYLSMTELDEIIKNLDIY